MNWSRGCHRLFFALVTVWIIGYTNVLVFNGLYAARARANQLRSEIRKEQEERNWVTVSSSMPIMYVDEQGNALPGPPLGFVVDDPPKRKFVDVPNVGRIEFDGSLSDAQIRSILKRDLSKDGVTADIFDLLPIENAAKKKTVEYREKRAEQLREAERQSSYHGQLATLFMPPHLRRTLAIVILPPVLLYGIVWASAKTLRWVISGFKTAA